MCGVCVDACFHSEMEKTAGAHSLQKHINNVHATIANMLLVGVDNGLKAAN